MKRFIVRLARSLRAARRAFSHAWHFTEQHEWIIRHDGDDVASADTVVDMKTKWVHAAPGSVLLHRQHGELVERGRK